MPSSNEKGGYLSIAELVAKAQEQETRTFVWLDQELHIHPRPITENAIYSVIVTSMQNEEGGYDDIEAFLRLRASWIPKLVTHADGTPFCTEDEIPALLTLPQTILMPLLDEIESVAQLTKAQAEEARKKSEKEKAAADKASSVSLSAAEMPA